MIKTKTTNLHMVLLMGLALSFVVSLKLGAMDFSLLGAFKDLLQNKVSERALVLWEIRLPRALMGLLLGMTLGLSGAAMQGFLRNPLAEPGVLGVTGGAVFGAVLMLYTGVSAQFALALPIGGMLGALISVILLHLCAGFSSSLQTLILSGIALNTLAFSGTSLIVNLSKNPYATVEIIFWQMGSLSNRSFEHLLLAAPFILVGLALLVWDRRALNTLTLGEETAMSLGVPISLVRMRLILGTALSVGAAVSVCGSIGFVGLVVPHLLRPFVDHEPGKLLGVSALGGGILILLADIVVRLAPMGNELKLGVLTSLIGAPFFIWILLKMKRSLT